MKPTRRPNVPQASEIRHLGIGTHAARASGVHDARERLARLDSASLSDAELLAILIGTGLDGERVSSLALRVLQDAGGLWALGRMSMGELRQIRGLGPVKAARLLAAFQIGCRGLIAPEIQSSPLSNSELVFIRYGRPLMASRIERFFVIPVDAKNRARAEREVARGGRIRCQVDPAEVFRLVLAESASGAIFIHNHPSGDPQPSTEDLELTERLVAAGALLGVRILDHIIVGSGRYTSLRDAGLWPNIPLKSDTSARRAP